MREEKSRIVYSTDREIPRKRKPIEKAPETRVSPSQQKVSISLDRKSRGGKSVTLIKGLQTAAEEREALLKQLKSRLGTGGTLKSGVFEIQGDHRDSIIEFLEGLGYRAKRSGG